MRFNAERLYYGEHAWCYAVALVDLGALPNHFTQLVQQVLAIPSHRQRCPVWLGYQMVECCLDIGFTHHYFLFAAPEHIAPLYVSAKDCLMCQINSVYCFFHNCRHSTCWNALQSLTVAYRILLADLWKLATVAFPWAFASFCRFGLCLVRIYFGEP